jgi:predicted lipoprotein
MDNAETITRAKLNPALSSSKANPYLLESWRSRNSLANIQDNLDALEKMLTNGGIANYLQAKSMGQAQQQLSSSLERAQAALGQISEPLETLAGTDNAQLAAALAALTEFRTIVSEQVVTDLELPIGFNDNDGD